MTTKSLMATLSHQSYCHSANPPLVVKCDQSGIRMFALGTAPLTGDLVDALWKRLKIKGKQASQTLRLLPRTMQRHVHAN